MTPTKRCSYATSSPTSPCPPRRTPCSSLQHSPVTPQLLHHVLHFLGPLSRPQLALTLGGKFGHIHLCKLLQGEGPTMETRPEANSPKDRVNLREQEKAVKEDKQKPQLPSPWVPWASDIRFHQLPSGQSEEILVIMYRMPNFAFIPSTRQGLAVTEGTAPILLRQAGYPPSPQPPPKNSSVG